MPEVKEKQEESETRFARYYALQELLQDSLQDDGKGKAKRNKSAK